MEKAQTPGEQMSEAAKEIHNYGRVLLAATLTCIIALVGISVTAAIWGGKIDQRVTTTEQRLAAESARITEIDESQRGMTGRLATIEERTGNIVKGLDRIENKVDASLSGGQPRRSKSGGD